VSFGWAEIRASVTRAVCLGANCGVAFGDQFCRNPRSGAVDELIDPVLRDIIGLFLSIPPIYRYQPEGLEDACRLQDQGARNAAAAESLLADAEFMRAFLPRLHVGLKAAQAVCRDCPPIPLRTLREVSWSDLSYYLSAFVVPHVRTHADGQVEGAFRICSGTEAAAQIPSADIALLRMGLFIAQRSGAVREVSADEMSNAMASPEFGKLAGDTARNSWVKQRVAERLTLDPAVRESACQLLAEYEIALGVVMSECRSRKQ
jgi:hypothetical protein